MGNGICSHSNPVIAPAFAQVFVFDATIINNQVCGANGGIQPCFLSLHPVCPFLNKHGDVKKKRTISNVLYTVVETGDF